MAMDATKHDSCDLYFSPLYQAVEIVMQRVYGGSELHRNSFVNKGYVMIWDEHLKDIAEERWIDSIFGISALLSVTTQLNHSQSQGLLCVQHGLPFLRLAQAAASNIAIHMIDDALMHLSSMKFNLKTNLTVDISRETIDPDLELFTSYWRVVDGAIGVVEQHLAPFQVEMVFAQFRFRELVTKQWRERKVA
jgi:hypothetical protein